jgi:hypothetical protein
MSVDPIALLAEDKEKISYRPRLNEITGSVIATILLQQIVYWWWKSGKQPFYKFSAPCAHPTYKAGDSWQEELGISRSELETALRKIGRKINRNDSKTDALKTSLVIYWTGFDRLTYYEVNESLLGEKLASLYGNAEKSHYDERNAGKSHYVMQESSITKCRNPAIDRSETTRDYQEREKPTRAPAENEHPAIALYTTLTGAKPQQFAAEKIRAEVTDLARWEREIKNWLASGHKRENAKGMLDWYHGKGKHQNGRDERVAQTAGLSSRPAPAPGAQTAQQSAATMLKLRGK